MGVQVTYDPVLGEYVSRSTGGTPSIAEYAGDGDPGDALTTLALSGRDFDPPLDLVAGSFGGTLAVVPDAGVYSLFASFNWQLSGDAAGSLTSYLYTDPGDGIAQDLRKARAGDNTVTVTLSRVAYLPAGTKVGTDIALNHTDGSDSVLSAGTLTVCHTTVQIVRLV